MIKSTLITLVFLFSLNAVYAQNTGPRTFYYRYIIPHYEYGGFHSVGTLDSADFYRVILPPDTGEELYNVKEFYKNGKAKFAGKSTGPYFVLEGKCISFFPNGKRNQIGNYHNGMRSGKQYLYFPNSKLFCIENYDLRPYYRSKLLYEDCYDTLGNATAKDGNGHWLIYDNEFKHVMLQGEVKDGLKVGEWTGGSMDSDSIRFVFQYKNGEAITAKSYDKTGKEYSFKYFYVPATYKNGNDVFLRMLRNRVVLPKDEHEQKIRDTVSVAFIVEKDGHLTNFEVIGQPNPALGAAALAALRQSPDWEARKYYGIPMRSKITITLNMKKDANYLAKYTEEILDMKLMTAQE